MSRSVNFRKLKDHQKRKQAARDAAVIKLLQMGTPVFLRRPEVCAMVGVSYPTLWAWMRNKDIRFPRSHIAGGHSVWLSNEVLAWMADRPIRRLKGDSSTPETDRTTAPEAPAAQPKHRPRRPSKQHTDVTTTTQM